MALINYVEPENWTDKGMKWESPDPVLLDYAMAVTLAIYERCRAANITRLPAALNKCQWRHPLAYGWLEAVRDCVFNLCEYYINPDKLTNEVYQKAPDEFPVYLTPRDMTDLGIAVLPPPHSPPGKGIVDFLIAAYNCLNKMHILPFVCDCVKKEGYGDEHDPPFKTAVSKAISNAKENMEENIGRDYPESKVTVSASSSSTHYTEGDEEEPKDGYCGFADIVYYEIKNMETHYRSGDTFTMVYADKCEDSVGYADEVSSNEFNSGNFQATQGQLTRLPLAVGTIIGSTTIPKLEKKPSSYFPPEDSDEKTIRRGNITGYRATAWFFVDCNKNFKFK